MLIAFALAACAAGSASPSARDQSVPLSIRDLSGGPDAPSSASPIAAPGKPPEASAARLAAPVGNPRYALGFDQAKDGCLTGHVYTQPPGSTRLLSDYAKQPPNATLWGCEWNFSDRKLSEVLPAAKPQQSYAVRYQGTFQVATSGTFDFGVMASSDARIAVDSGALVEGSTDAAGGPFNNQQKVYLGAGRHQILIEYLAAGETLSFNVNVTLPGSKQATPFSMRPGGQFYAEQGLDYTGPAGGSGEEWRKLVDVEAGQLKLNGRVFFLPNSAELDRIDKTEDTLLAVAKTLKEREMVACVEIEGHTDNRGEAWSNLQLSRERAEAVQTWLIRAGIGPHRLVAVGFGGARPLASNETEEGRAQNRRVELLLVKPDSAGACPRGEASSSSPPARVERQAAPELAERACNASSALRNKLLLQLEPWLKEHRNCSTDADCTQAIPLECPGKSRSLDCAWVLVNQSSVDSLRVTGARLDSVGNYCQALPEDGLVRSCGGCAAKARRCASGVCQLGGH
ncbi:MAG: OmpA family protein [Pseudomonadota bacterium]